MVKLSEIKEAIKSFSKDMDYKDYYLNLMLNNKHRWLYVNPNKCKPSIRNCAFEQLRFACLKKFLKNGYTMKYDKLHNGYIFIEKGK